jgi:hypothetical protein
MDPPDPAPDLDPQHCMDGGLALLLEYTSNNRIISAIARILLDNYHIVLTLWLPVLAILQSKESVSREILKCL